MFKNRYILILVVVLVVLLGINIFQKADHRQSTNQSTTAKVIETTFTADQLDRITVGQGLVEVAVDLVATPAGWLVASAWDAPANQQRIDALLRGVSNLSGEFRSDNESVLGDYSLADDNAVKVRAFGKDGNIAFALDIGNTPEGVPGSFISLPGSNAVYLTQTNLLSNLGLYDGPAPPDNKHFLDLQAVQEDRQDVDRVILNDAGQSLELNKVFALEVAPPSGEEVSAESGEEAAAEPAIDRTTWEWQLASPRTAAPAKTKADAVLGALVNVRAVDVDDPSGDLATYGLEPPTRTATMVFSGGAEATLEFGNTREAEGDKQAGVWMRVRGEPGVWIATDYTVKNIFKTVDELLPDQE